MKSLLLAAAMLTLPASAFAQAAGEPPVMNPSPSSNVAATAPTGLVEPAGPSATEVRVNQLILYGDQTCPESTDEQINICARSKTDPYRIDENLRELPGPQSNSWANQASELSYVGRGGAESCSTTGPGGFTGCLGQIINSARAERRDGDAVNWERLIEEARQERLGRIDAEAEAVQREIDERPK